jgi:hypothetical protein
MIFYIHIIFQPFRSFIHVIHLQNFIIQLQMDPGDQLYTLDELRCWKVENLRVLDDERSNEIGNEGGASYIAPCVFRHASWTCLWCHHNMMFWRTTRDATTTFWVSVELQTPFRFILVGLMNMIMVCSLAIKFFGRHNAVLVIPWWCSIDKWHAERL